MHMHRKAGGVGGCGRRLRWLVPGWLLLIRNTLSISLLNSIRFLYLINLNSFPAFSTYRTSRTWCQWWVYASHGPIVWLPNSEQQISSEHCICNFSSHNDLKLYLCVYLSLLYCKHCIWSHKSNRSINWSPCINKCVK